MPYRNEFASGDSLWRLVESESVKEFQGMVQRGDPEDAAEPPRTPTPQRGQDRITRIIVIDGSTVTSAVRTGYPGAEAALLQLAAVIIDLEALRNLVPGSIPRPSSIRGMEDCTTLDAVLPGKNVVRRDVDDDTPRQFFRATIHEMLSGKRVDSDHETLIETMRAITSSREASCARPRIVERRFQRSRGWASALVLAGRWCLRQTASDCTSDSRTTDLQRRRTPERARLWSTWP